ncbi:rhomboid family intramembrane serine protease [Pseudotenacibaculum sp. MALMAid0570]|uniref:rhomboid family intramembrane serine protease n=1 Tax=Pseudotenacibaculum sp. MALMAid0570 TaxID=3143938 RepID=UPI0032DF04C9
MSILKDLQIRFKKGSILEQLIYINIAVFILTLIIGSFSGLFNSKPDFIVNWFALSSSLDTWITRPWTIITYGFFHDGFLHILFNCLWLYIFGRLFSDYFTPKQLLTFYLLGTVFGGIAYMLSYNFFPVFEGKLGAMVGASAGVSAIVIGIATYIPNYQLRFRFIGYIKVWHLAGFFILMDLIQLAGSNGGGHFSHLGGALFGFFYVSQASNKKLNIFGSLSNLFKRKQKPLRTVHKSKRRPAPQPKHVKPDKQQKIDDILDKISKSGYDTLSKEEKEFLFKQGK